MQLRVEKNIPVWAPERATKSIRQIVDRMEFGDSIMVKDLRQKNNLLTAIASRNHKAVSRQIVENDKVVGWRVWKQPKVAGA